MTLETKSSLKFTIVTCTRNSAGTLRDTIDSVRTQDYQDIEHVFIDGGSTDGTLEIIESLCPNAVVRRNITGGISRAMNVGIEAATGDVIAHLHSDDYYAQTDVISVVAAVLENGAQWAYGKISVLRDGVLIANEYPMRSFSLRRYAAGYVSVPHPAVFVRRSAFEKVGFFNERLRYAMDIELWFRLGTYYMPAQIDRTLTVFREHAGSLSTANKLQAREEDWQVRLGYLKTMPLETARYAIRHWRGNNSIRREMGKTKA
jgi:glycosyltransferase involved in cell wall biosynthesis